MERKQKRYYKIEETVWIKSEGVLGVIKEMNVKPEEQVYEVMVEILEGEQKGSKLKVNLWEIDKNKRPSAKAKKQQPILTVPKKPTILFAKVKPEAIIPSRDEENAGYDIYACVGGDVVFEPHQTIKVPTGIASSITKDFALIAKERGSTGDKGMGLRAGVVDSGYRGEILIMLTNENSKTLVITSKPELYDAEKVIVYPMTKAIAQLLLVPVIDAYVKEISYEQLRTIPSKRGTGKLGSSGK